MQCFYAGTCYVAEYCQSVEKNDVAVLISDMKYSPVGSAAPEVLLTQYAAEVALIAGKSQKAYSLVCATSNYINKEGSVVTNESPYYYLIVGEQDKVSAVRNGIAIMLQRQKRFVDNLEIGYKYASCPYDLVFLKCCSIRKTANFLWIW